MNGFSKIVSAAGLAVGLALAAAPAMAQQKEAVTTAPTSSTPAAIAAATEILKMKNTAAMYAGAVPGIIEKTKTGLLQQYLNYQKDLNEVAVIIAKNNAGRESEISEGMAKVYAGQFTEQELKDLVTFYKSPLGQKLIAAEPRAIQSSMAYMNSWGQNFASTVNGEFRAEMRKRGKEI